MGDAADYFHVRDKIHDTTKLKGLAVMESQMNEVAVTPTPTTFGELMEYLDIDPGIPQMPQGTSWPGSSHIRLGSGKPQSNKPIASLQLNTEPYSSQMKNLKAVEPVSFYGCILHAELFTILQSDSNRAMVTVRVFLEKLIGKLVYVTLYRSEKLFMDLLCYLSAIS